MELREIPGYEGVYSVDRIGNVWRVGGWGTSEPRKLKNILNNNGYHSVMLSKNNKQKRMQVHRLVAMAFIGPPPEKADVCHLNHVRTDNRLENLCYGTRSENCKMSSHRYGLWRKGVKPASAKLKEHQYQEILNRYGMGAFQVDIASEYGVTQGMISRIIRGEVKCLKSR